MPDQPSHHSFNFYQNANADAGEIKENFLIRLHEYEIIIEDLHRNHAQRSVQHYLLLGRRGSGKSTLLKRVQAEIDTDENLHKRYIAVNLAEEQANIYKLSDLLEEILQELDYRKIEIEQPDQENDPHSYSRNLFAAIHRAIESSGKKLVLLLDNIDRIFENLQEDASLLREYLLNYHDIKIIGGSTRMTEHFWKYNKPFYEFFRVLELKPLTSDEIKKLLLNWSQKLNLPQIEEFVVNRPGQLEMVRLLTDGLPRTLQFFINILINKTQETGYEYLRLIMDKVTPLYQERLNNLPPAQRKIVLQMAFIWEATGAKELAVAAKMENNVISAQLKQLADKGIAEKIETHTKNHLYRLSERFFNLWLIFTQGNPREKRKAKYLTIFLENFYDANELKILANEHLKAISERKLSPDKAALLTKALSQSRYISYATRDLLIQGTLQLPEIQEVLKKQLPPTTFEIADEIEKLVQKKEYTKAIALAGTIEQVDGMKELLFGYIHYKNGKIQAAEENYLESVNKGVVVAAAKLGALYSWLNKLDLAEKYLTIAAEKDDPEALTKLGNLHFLRNEHILAEKKYLLAIAKGSRNASFWLANLYYSTNTKKETALELIQKPTYENWEDLRMSDMIVIKAWAGDLASLEEALLNYLAGGTDYLDTVLLDLLVHSQKNLVSQVFSSSGYGEKLKEEFLPLYYVTQVLMNKEANILLKIPPEMQETVDGLIKYVQEGQEFYYGKDS